MGVNTLIDAFVSPINVTAKYVEQISRGDYPEKITEEYKGDFSKIRNNLNTLIENGFGAVRVAEKIADGELAVDVDILSEKLVLGIYRENPSIENGVFFNNSRSLNLSKFTKETLESELNKMITPVRDQFK